LQKVGAVNLTDKYFDEEYFDGGKGYHCYNDDPRFQVYADYIVKTYSPKSVLDFGCAKGYLVKALRDRGVEAYGYDVSKWAIAQADDNIKKFLTSSKLRFVDLIVSIDTLEHIPVDQVPRIIQDIKTKSKRQYLVVGTVNTPNWEHDASHVTIKKLSYWQNILPGADWVESV